MDLTAHPALLVMAIAVVASLLAEIRIGTLRVPVVVWEMGFGMLVGSHGLALARSSDLLEWLGHGAGLAALFFMAGIELDLQKSRAVRSRLRFLDGVYRLPLHWRLALLFIGCLRFTLR
jgi:Kef-type K+ transport system membrane component KefB